MTIFNKRPLAASVASAMLLSAASTQVLAQQEIDEIVVVGSQIRGAQISDALPVSVMNELDIEALAVSSLSSLTTKILSNCVRAPTPNNCELTLSTIVPAKPVVVPPDVMTGYKL